MTTPRWIMLIGALVMPAAAFAQSKAPRALFADDRPLHLIIRGPVDAAAKGPVDAILATAGEARPESLAVKLTARGISRRTRAICPFPPLSVAFAAKPAPGSLFEHAKRLKLVTHCRQAAPFQQYQLLELAAYRMYELLTPLSFRTRLATIDYVRADGKPIVSRTGFFIEDLDDLGRRNGLKEYKTTARVASARLNPRDAARYALFQVMIGNLDWAMIAGPAGTECCHNSKLLGDLNTPGGLVPVPYDFDFAGMVDAPYATPPQGIDIVNVRERRYYGYCRTNPELPAAAADLLERRAAILRVLDTMPGLEPRSRDKARAYLARFLDELAMPQGVQKLIAKCVS